MQIVDFISNIGSGAQMGEGGRGWEMVEECYVQLGQAFGHHQHRQMHIIASGLSTHYSRLKILGQ